ncbi:MAG: MFS transporter [Candidatus Woesearchaeota archaeon]
MNKILRLLVMSDVFVFSGYGLISPILAIFINDNLVGGSILAAGLASTIFLITQSLLQILFSYVFNPKDRLWMIWVGTGLIALVPFGYIFSSSVYHLYFVQFIYGVGAAFAYPSWSSLFTSNLEKGKRGFQWSIYSSAVGLGTALTAVAGAWLAEYTSFEIVFLLAGVFSIAGLIILSRLDKKQVMKKV